MGQADVFINVLSNQANVKRICDLGCGSGYVAGRLSSLGYDVTGIDASVSSVELAANNFPETRFVCATLDTIAKGNLEVGDFD